MHITITAGILFIRLINRLQNPLFKDIAFFEHVSGVGGKDVSGHCCLLIQFTTKVFRSFAGGTSLFKDERVVFPAPGKAGSFHLRDDLWKVKQDMKQLVEFFT